LRNENTTKKCLGKGQAAVALVEIQKEMLEGESKNWGFVPGVGMSVGGWSKSSERTQEGGDKNLEWSLPSDVKKSRETQTRPRRGE